MSRGAANAGGGGSTGGGYRVIACGTAAASSPQITLPEPATIALLACAENTTNDNWPYDFNNTAGDLVMLAPGTNSVLGTLGAGAFMTLDGKYIRFNRMFNKLTYFYVAFA